MIEENIIKSLKATIEYEIFLENASSFLRDIRGNSLEEILNITKLKDSHSDLVEVSYSLFISYIKSILGEISDKVDIHFYNSEVSIIYNKEWNSCYIEDKSLHYYPAKLLFKIDFKNRVITEKDLEDDYKFCFDNQAINIKNLASIINMAKEDLEKLKMLKKSNRKMARAIHKRYKHRFSKIQFFEYVILACFTKKNKILLIATFDEIVRKKEEKLENMNLKLEKLTGKSYLQVYTEIKELQEEIMEKFKNFGYEVKIEEVSR